MFAWIADNAVTIIAIAAVLAAVGIAVRSLVKSKKRGGCTGNCASCGMGCSCCEKKS
jgi:hypothetical protein